MEYQQITITEWMTWREDIRKKLAETADNFVYIGYRLRQIRDSGMMDGCADIFEFAAKEYGLSKSTVSRFIAINEKFASLSDPLHLQPEYIGIGHSKLSEMLTLSDEECQLITEKTTVKAIRELKQMAKEEEQEKTARTEEKQGFSAVATSQRSPMERCIEDFFSAEKRAAVLDRIMDEYEEEPTDGQIRELVELINPNGAGTHRKGPVMLFFYDLDKGVKYRQMGQSEVKSISWETFIRLTRNIYREDAEAAGGSLSVWSLHYKKEEAHEEVEEKPGTAPEPEKSEGKGEDEKADASSLCDGDPENSGDGIPGRSAESAVVHLDDTDPEARHRDEESAGTEMEDNVSDDAEGTGRGEGETVEENHVAGEGDAQEQTGEPCRLETIYEGLCREIRETWQQADALLEPTANPFQLKTVKRKVQNMLTTLDELIKAREEKDEWED